MTFLALVRHGQSEWNLQNRFTGWVDVDLTEQGRAEARRAGALLKETGIAFSGAYTSVQKRAIRTLDIALDEMDRLWLPVTKDWRLNERHYGGLTGLDKKETAAKHGDEQVKIWRRSYDTPPPPIEEASPFNPARDPRYAALGDKIPKTESLKTTLDRVMPLWTGEIAPRLMRGQSLLIAAHGNSLRALVKLLLRVSDDKIVDVEIPTGNPLLFEFAPGSLSPTSSRYLDAARATPLPPLV
ncbi:MAG TPA: 2,3-diphosphoglycerate-dependent phosphoglycerate mutase [Parvularcula sp.]|nr:2,3-diphosphoglycerate-dependent phosphoglycerate mutase [Parvularcula sp.]HBS32301.1 2,3-diphosphoglycerate-dependent phosphoglycerate mutase [Parvularcula sp.]HBS36780.1 2,3-diphosphoglycerate-dependent phosphoglycerate mutase [Parvularcula sp.]